MRKSYSGKLRAHRKAFSGLYHMREVTTNGLHNCNLFICKHFDDIDTSVLT